MLSTVNEGDLCVSRRWSASLGLVMCETWTVSEGNATLQRSRAEGTVGEICMLSKLSFSIVWNDLLICISSQSGTNWNGCFQGALCLTEGIFFKLFTAHSCHSFALGWQAHHLPQWHWVWKILSLLIPTLSPHVMPCVSSEQGISIQLYNQIVLQAWTKILGASYFPVRGKKKFHHAFW